MPSIPKQLNIKNEETCRIVHEFVSYTGMSVPAAVARAVKELHDRMRAEDEEHDKNSGPQRDKASRLLAIGEDCAKHLREPMRSVDHGELLYDDAGLPR